MDTIGGYFELELRKGQHYHKGALCLNTARNCFEYILLAHKYVKVYIPYYTCDVMLQPLHKHNIDYEFYHIDENLEPTELKCLHCNEAFLYTNYFGLKQNYVEYLADIYKSQLIIDNSQAFYAKSIQDIDTFYSARKFFGVPDGAYLYTNCFLDIKLEQDKSYMRMQHLLQRIDEGAEASYSVFRQNEDVLDNQPIKLMSNLTANLLLNIDYKKIKEQRLQNYKILDDFLSSSNEIKLKINNDCVPMVYPYLTNDLSLRKKLIDNRIFVAKYWPNVQLWTEENALERKLADCIIPLPVDQRYNKNDINIILSKI